MLNKKPFLTCCFDRFKRKRFMRVVSLLLIESMLFSSIVFADGGSLSKADSLSIPKNIGSVKERFQAENDDTLVIHIQDTHTSYSAQKYLAKILEYLNVTYGTDLIAIEGSIGEIETSEFSRFPDKAVKNKVADCFLNEGKIDGAEYLCIVENQGDGNDLYKLHGVEVETLYKSNLNAFLRSLPYQKELLYFCDIMNDNVSKIKQHVYGDKLFQFDNIVQQFKNNEINFIVFCQNLMQFAEENLVEYDDMDDLGKLFEVIKLEAKINFPRVDVERYVAVRRISNKLPEEESTELLAKEFNFRTKKISSDTYHFYLSKLFEENEFPIDEFPHLKNYINYLSQFSKIDQNKALDESSVFEERIYDAFIENEEQAKLHEISRYIHLISKFSHLQMTRDYLVKYHECRNELKLNDIVAFLDEKGKEFGQDLLLEIDLSAVETNLDNFEDFYDLAHKREQVLVKNTIDLMNDESKEVVVLIAGGFHTRGITEMLKSEDKSYIVVTPNMENDKKPIPYISLLQNLRTPLEQMLATHTSTLKIASWLTKDAPLVYAERQDFLASKMKTLLTTTKLYELYMNVLVKYSAEERMLIQGRLENQLKESIAKVLETAGYQEDIQVDDISLTFDDISVRMRLSGVASPIYVRYTDRLQTDKVDPEIENSLLEMVQLNDGITSEFMSSLGYLKATKSYRTLRTQLLGVLYDKAMTSESILTALSELNPDTEITSSEVDALLASFTKLGLVEEDKKNFFVSRKEPSRFSAYLVMSLFADKVKEGALADTDLGVIKVENIDAKYQNIFNRLNIGTLIVEPMLPLETLKQLADKLTSFGAEKELAPGDTIDLSDLAQINVISGTDKYILHVMSKPQIESTGETDAAASPEIAEIFNISGRGVAPEVAEQSPIAIQERFIDALESLIGNYPLDVTGNIFTQGEKAAILDYLYKLMDVNPENDSEVEYALHKYIGLAEATTPYYTKRVGSLIMGNAFNSQYDNSLLKLLAINPELEVNSELEQSIASAIIFFNLDKQKGMSGYTQWFDLVSKVVAQTPKAHQKTQLNSALANALETVKAREAQSENPLTMDEISAIVNDSVLSMEFKLKDAEKPVLLSAARRKSFLDKAMTDKDIIRFESQNNSVGVELTIIQKNADGTYTAMAHSTGDIYKISLLSASTKNGEFNFKELDSETQAAFNDQAGFFLERINPTDVPIDSNEARLNFYANLESYWQKVIKNEAPAQIEGVIDTFDGYSETQTLTQQINKGNEYIASRLEKITGQMDGVKSQLREIELREFSIESLVKSQQDLQTNRETLQKDIKRLDTQIDFSTKRQDELARQKMELLEIIVARLVLQQLFTRLDKVAADAMRRGQDAVYEVNQTLSAWIDIEPGERIADIMSSRTQLLKRLKLREIFNQQDYQDLGAVLKELGNAGLVKSVVQNLFSRNSNAIQSAIMQNVVHSFNQAVTMKRNSYHHQDQPAPDTARIQRLEKMVDEFSSTTIGMRSLKDLNAQAEALDAEVLKLKTDLRKKKLQVTTGYSEQFARLQSEIDRFRAENVNDAANKDKFAKDLDRLIQTQQYLKLLDGSLKQMQKAIDAGQTTIKINNKQFPLIPENFQVIAYGLAYQNTVVDFFKAEDKYRYSKDQNERRVYEVLKAVTERAYRNFYEKSTSAVMETPVAFAELGAQDPADYLIYGENPEGNFSQFQNKTDNYRINTLVDQSLALLSRINPELAGFVSNNMSIAVSAKPFLPTSGKGLDNLISMSADNKTIFVGKAVFGKIAELIDSNPRLAVRLMAASILASAQPVFNAGGNMININTADRKTIGQMMIDRLAATNPDIFAREEAKAQALTLITRTVDAILAKRDAQGGEFTSLDDLAELNHDPVFNLIAPLLTISDISSKDAYKNAVQQANAALGLDYSNVLKLLQIERDIYMDALVADNLPAHLAKDDVESWTSVFRNNTLPTENKYQVFFQRIFGTSSVFDQMKEIFSDFDAEASPELMLENSRRLNEFLETFLNFDNYVVRSRRNKEGEMEYSVIFPNNTKVQMNAEEMDTFQTRITTLQDSFYSYYHPQTGVGIMVKFPNKRTKALPPLVQNPAVKTDANLILKQARVRQSSEVLIDSVLQPQLSAVLDLASAPTLEAQTAKTSQEFLNQRNIASNVRDSLKTIAEQIPDQWIQLTHAERKALAAMLLTQSQVGLEWVDFVTGLYSPNVPIVTTQKVRSIFSNFVEGGRRTNFITAKHEMLDLIGQDNWSELDPSVRKTIFDRIVAKYELSAERTVNIRGNVKLDEISALAKYFERYDKQAAQAEPSRLTVEALLVLWDNEKEKLSESTDAAYIDSVFSSYLENINAIRQELLAQEGQDEAWKESVGNELDMLNFFETRLKEGRFVNVFQAVEEFNEQYKGIVSINADRVYIAENADQVLALVSALRSQKQIDETTNPDDKMRYGILNDYVKAKQLWADGEHAKAFELLKNIGQRIQDNNLYQSSEARTGVYSDIKYMEPLLSQPEKIAEYQIDDVFSSFDSVFKETLNRMPAQYYMQTLLSIKDYVFGGVTPVKGITDLIINLRDTISDSEVFEDYNRTKFEKEGITSEGSWLFINPSVFDLKSDNAYEQLSDNFKAADDQRMRDLDASIRHLSDLGLPKDVRLLNFSNSALESIDSQVEKLENGFKTHNISYSKDDFGKEVPVALHPAKYQQLLDKEKEAFNTVRNLINEATRLINEEGDYDSAKVLLVQSQYIIANLQHLSKQIRASILNVLTQDIQDLERRAAKAETVSTTETAILLHGTAVGNVVPSDALNNDPVAQRLLKSAFEKYAGESCFIG